MKTTKHGIALATILILALGFSFTLRAQSTPDGMLGSWSFNDATNWTSDSGHFPITATNLTASTLGDGKAMVMDTNSVLSYQIVEADGSTNLTPVGSLILWYAPAWAGTNEGG